jgi:hypothetical protein
MAIVAEHALTFEAIQEIFNTYGNRIKFIKTENNTIVVNQKVDGLPYLTFNDLVNEKYDGYDFIKVRTYDPFFRKEYDSLIRVHDIRTFVIADKETDVLDAFRC